jgi:enamine deaminase RidA (YjgF/YER057c/UK114 family)
MNKTLRIEHLNPAGMRQNPAFTNVVAVSGAGRTLYIGAIDPVDVAGALVGPGDLAAQTTQVFKNLELALAGGGATLEQIVLWRIYIVEGQAMERAAGVFMQVWGRRPNPPANTIVFVPALGYPGSLIALEALAVVPA